MRHCVRFADGVENAFNLGVEFIAESLVAEFEAGFNEGRVSSTVIPGWRRRCRGSSFALGDDWSRNSLMASCSPTRGMHPQ